MQKKQIKKITIEHYNEMIAWVKTQDPKAIPDKHKMFNVIGHNWNDCPYCQFYKDRCYIHEECPLGISDHCCNNLWDLMNNSKTWRKWLIYAEKKLKYIKKNG